MKQNKVSFQNPKTGEPLSQQEIDEMFMPLATSYMIALADDSSFCAHDDRTHHRIRFRILPAVLSQLQAAAHKHFVNLLLRERL